VNADWHISISLTYADGGQIEFHVYLNLGCVNFSKTNSEIITTFINTDTLELYVGARSGLYGRSRIFERH